MICRHPAHIVFPREIHRHTAIAVPQTRNLIQYNHADKDVFVLILVGFVIVYIYPTVRIYVGKNKSCTQQLAICKLETCKGHLRKVIQFTLAKRKHISYSTLKLCFLHARLDTDKSWHFQVDYVQRPLEESTLHV